MRFVEFLILMLEAQAQTLQRLAAFFSEEVLMDMLERVGDAFDSETLIEVNPEWFERPLYSSSHESVYRELEGSVREFKLPAVLEFHLWAYPPYRSLIESPVELDSKIRGLGSDAGAELTDQTMNAAEIWIKGLPIPPDLSKQAERAAQIPWIRFRTEALKRVGRRPMGPVY